MSQDHYWKELYRLKVHVIYVESLLAETEAWDRRIKVFSAITSSASIGAWAIWKDYAAVWGSIIAISQVLNAIRQYFPYKDRLRCYSGLRLELEEILLGVEARWLEIASGECTEMAIRKALAEMRAKRHRAFKIHLPKTTIPDDGPLFRQAEDRALAYFQNFYFEEADHEDNSDPTAIAPQAPRAIGGETTSRAAENAPHAQDSAAQKVAA